MVWSPVTSIFRSSCWQDQTGNFGHEPKHISRRYEKFKKLPWRAEPTESNRQHIIAIRHIARLARQEKQILQLMGSSFSKHLLLIGGIAVKGRFSWILQAWLQGRRHYSFLSTSSQYVNWYWADMLNDANAHIACSWQAHGKFISLIGESSWKRYVRIQNRSREGWSFKLVSYKWSSNS